MTQPDAPSPRRNLGRWILLAVVAAAVAVFFALGGHETLSWEAVRERQDELRSWSVRQPVATAGVFLLAYVVVAALALPGAVVLSVLGGFLFGRWGGTLLVSFASTLGAILAFLASRYLFRDAVHRRLGPQLEAFDRGVERDGAFYLATLRLLPVVPFFLVNVGMGLTRMRLVTYWWVSQVAMLPATFVFANAGAEWEKVRSPADVLSPTVLVSLGLLAALPLLLRWAVRGQGRSG
jgi:uncharacterized membrane protein YdjX (TVP38/TMEM64 family)